MGKCSKKNKVSIEDYNLEAGTDKPDPRDPRMLGVGPCDNVHALPGTWQGNQYAVWKACQRCALRLEYHPHKKATGQYAAASPDPLLVMRVFEVAKDVAKEDWTRHLFDGYMKLVQGERRTGHSLRTGQRPTTKGRGGRRGPDGGDDDPDLGTPRCVLRA